jgi:hypothetical protein
VLKASNLPKLLGILILAGALPATAIAEAPADATAAATARFSVETTNLGTLLDDPGSRAVLEKHLPDLVGNEQAAMARPLTLRQLQSYAGDQVTDEALVKVQAELDKLPAK